MKETGGGADARWKGKSQVSGYTASVPGREDMQQAELPQTPLTVCVLIEWGQQAVSCPAVQLLRGVDLIQLACEAFLEDIIQVELTGVPLNVAEEH